jgi:hypothetical protein
MLTMDDELGLHIMQPHRSPCWAYGSIVTDLYRVCLHVYNCMRSKYHSLLQNHFSFAAPFSLSGLLFSLSRGL